MENIICRFKGIDESHVGICLRKDDLRLNGIVTIKDNGHMVFGWSCPKGMDSDMQERLEDLIEQSEKQGLFNDDLIRNAAGEVGPSDGDESHVFSNRFKVIFRDDVCDILERMSFPYDPNFPKSAITDEGDWMSFAGNGPVRYVRDGETLKLKDAMEDIAKTGGAVNLIVTELVYRKEGLTTVTMYVVRNGRLTVQPLAFPPKMEG